MQTRQTATVCGLLALLAPLFCSAAIGSDSSGPIKCTLAGQDYTLTGNYDIKGASSPAITLAGCAHVCQRTKNCNVAAFVKAASRCYPKTVPGNQPNTVSTPGVSLVFPSRTSLSCDRARALRFDASAMRKALRRPRRMPVSLPRRPRRTFSMTDLPAEQMVAKRERKPRAQIVRERIEAARPTRRTDYCRKDPLKMAPGVCGCFDSDFDSDEDGVVDCKDGCPYDALKTAPGTCGCGFVDVPQGVEGRFCSRTEDTLGGEVYPAVHSSVYASVNPSFPYGAVEGGCSFYATILLKVQMSLLPRAEVAQLFLVAADNVLGEGGFRDLIGGYADNCTAPNGFCWFDSSTDFAVAVLSTRDMLQYLAAEVSSCKLPVLSPAELEFVGCDAETPFVALCSNELAEIRNAELAGTSPSKAVRALYTNRAVLFPDTTRGCNALGCQQCLEACPACQRKQECKSLTWVCNVTEYYASAMYTMWGLVSQFEGKVPAGEEFGALFSSESSYGPDGFLRKLYDLDTTIYEPSFQVCKDRVLADCKSADEECAACSAQESVCV